MKEMASSDNSGNLTNNLNDSGNVNLKRIIDRNMKQNESRY